MHETNWKTTETIWVLGWQMMQVLDTEPQTCTWSWSCFRYSIASSSIEALSVCRQLKQKIRQNDPHELEPIKLYKGQNWLRVCLCTLLEFGIRFCNAFIFSLILLLLLCQTTPHMKTQKHNIGKINKIKTTPSQISKKKKASKCKSTFSDKLWTSAALLLFDEPRGGTDLAATSSTNASRPSCCQKSPMAKNKKLFKKKKDF